MSDHGESLPKDEKTFIKSNGTAKTITGLGHGTNSLQIKQHHIVLGIQHPALSPQNDSQMVSLIDIAPTLLELVPNLNHPTLDFDGFNVLNTNSKNLKKRWLSFETGYNVDAVKHAQLNEAEIFKQAAHAYKITPEGKVVIKDNIYDKLLSQKQYTWWDGEFLITHSQDSWDKYDWQDSTLEDISNPLSIRFQEGLNY
jgi:arylsulfatase A-like enzyme